MTNLQLSNYLINLEDEKISISNVAATWKLEISILNPRYQLLSYMINTPEMHKILEGYCLVNYLSAENVLIDKIYMDEFAKSYSECAKRQNARIKSQPKVKTPKIK